MIINMKPQEFLEFISDPKSWPSFLNFYYYLDGQLDVRTISGTKKVNFTVEQDGINPTIYISNDTLKFKYQFTVNNMTDTCDISLTTDYIIPFLESRALRLMGINLLIKNSVVLDNIQHFVDFGHIH